MGPIDNDGELQSQLLIVGASVRAAAQSAVRAGLKPICADMFADEDLRAIAQIIPVDAYPDQLAAAARGAPDCPWMYTGALENRPQIIRSISEQRTLWGNPPEAVARARDPLRLQYLLRDTGLPAAEIRSAADPPIPNGSWLVKPLHGSAGRGIAPWHGKMACSLREPHYFQRRVEGIACSAVFIATRNRVHKVGISRQRIGDPLLNARGFTYCGSSGPIFFEPKIGQQILETANAIAHWAKLRGVFGIDMIFDGMAAIPVEVNPRYTASVEIYEYAFNVSILDWHRRACESFGDASSSAELDEAISAALEPINRNCQGLGSRSGRHVEKAVLYADREICTPSLEEHAVRAIGDITVKVVDRPRAGSRIGPGQPICSLLATGPAEEGCRLLLDREANRLKEKLSIASDR